MERQELAGKEPSFNVPEGYECIPTEYGNWVLRKKKVAVDTLPGESLEPVNVETVVGVR